MKSIVHHKIFAIVMDGFQNEDGDGSDRDDGDNGGDGGGGGW